MYVPPRRTDCSLPPATAHATETFKSFWRQKKSVADLCGSRNLTAVVVYNLIPAIYSKRTPLPPHSLPLSPFPSPMFVLQSLNHRAGRVRECVAGRGRGGREGGYRPTDRVQRRPLHFDLVDSNEAFVECRRSRTGAPNSPPNHARCSHAGVRLTPSSPASLSAASPRGCGAV